MDNIYIKTICIIFIIFAHMIFLNKLEKSFFRILFSDHRVVYRPLEYCKNSYDFNIFCVGMPSGHTELATIVSMLLSHYDLLSLPIAILTICVVGLQRIITKKHNIEQVFVGLIFGLIYTKIYIETDVSEKSILLISGIILISTVILMLYIDDIIQNDKIPDWVDKKMYPTIEKKKNVPFYVKYSTILATLYFEDMPLYIDYKTLEIYLDECINKINESNIKFDAIVGIKSGGAIISNYIAKKLNITNYPVKVTSNIDKCDSNAIKYAESVVDILQSKKRSNKLCEGIDDNLENKNVILIDELVFTGSTMEYVSNYLINEKKVANLYLITITSTNGDILINNIKLNHVTNYKYSFIYPWGYDN